MITFERVIFPVGQGGFAYENIDDYSIVFDCGSNTCPTRVTQYIRRLGDMRVGKIDVLYVSHFDKDHVDGITQLIDIVGVKRAVIPYVPEAFRVAYNAITGGAYSSIREIITRREIELDELREERNNNIDVWEWISKPMLTMTDWGVLDHIFHGEGIDSNLLQDPEYVNQNKNRINDCFKTAFGYQGPNAKGLILLSQKTGGRLISNELFVHGGMLSIKETAALYTGDANLRANKYVRKVKSFLCAMIRGDLALMQIPHHGSEYNVGSHFDIDFPARYYYYHDKSSERLCRNQTLYNTLIGSHKLLDVRDVGSDLIEQRVKIDP